MSETYSRPRISRVQVAAESSVVQNARPLAEVIQPILAAASIAVGGLVAHAATKALTQSNTRMVEPVASLRQTFQSNQTKNLRKLQQTADLPQGQALRLATVAALHKTPFFIPDGTALKPLLDTASAKSLFQVQREIESVITAIEDSHHQILLSSLVLACTNASTAAGFTAIECAPGLACTTRIIATDTAGRTLVTEVTATRNSEPKIETEVVGVTDGSCKQIIEAFDKALEAQGVRSWEPPRKKFTGGVVELSASKEFIRRKLHKQALNIKAAAQPAGHRQKADLPRRQTQNHAQHMKQH